ncbi:MAG: glutamine synthetase family protein [Firmicutes bacterium]|nr:glutamine synthetase family protein [Bacillota bacterium]
MDPQDIIRLIDERHIEVVRVVFNDNANVARSRNIPAKYFRDVVLPNGVQYPSAMLSVDTAANFVVAAGAGFQGGYGSWLLKIDPETFTVIPWAKNSARVLADLYTLDGEPVSIAPRTVFRRVLGELERDGYQALGAAELEFYIFKQYDTAGYEPTWTGLQCYSEVKQGEVDELLYAIVTNLRDVGIDVEAANTEYGPGQFEVSINPGWGISQADRAFTFKAAIKEMMQQRGLLATFMTKPLNGRSGSGSHFHHSLYDKVTGRNVFYDASDPDGLSQTVKHFIAGQLAHARALSALANPTVNSYRRLRPYTFAPSNVTWGLENRMCMIRVPGARGQGTHLENRLPGADMNPYLMMAAMYAAGLDGIRRELPCPPPIVDQDAYALVDAEPLPRSLGEALDALNQDEPLVDLLGPEFVKSYTALKRHELQRFEDHVTDWEIDEYRELF